jgi:hypothetical protein
VVSFPAELLPHPGWYRAVYLSKTSAVLLGFVFAAVVVDGNVTALFCQADGHCTAYSLATAGDPCHLSVEQQAPPPFPER